jgi:hypothetical protein
MRRSLSTLFPFRPFESRRLSYTVHQLSRRHRHTPPSMVLLTEFISHPFACQSLTATFPVLPSYRMHVRIMLPLRTYPVCAMEAASRAGFSLDTPSLRPAMPRLASRLRLIKQGISISIFDRSVARITTNNPSEQLHLQTCSVCIHIFPAQSNVHSYCICPSRCSQKTTLSAFACLATLQGLLCTPSGLRVVTELLTPCSCIKCLDEMGRPQTPSSVCERSHSCVSGLRSCECGVVRTTQTCIGLLLCNIDYWKISKHSAYPVPEHL